MRRKKTYRARVAHGRHGFLAHCRNVNVLCENSPGCEDERIGLGHTSPFLFKRRVSLVSLYTSKIITSSPVDPFTPYLTQGVIRLIQRVPYYLNTDQQEELSHL